MNKDVIYIDAEDDITAIIGKVKASKEKVVALVPPKRAGAMHSAVNLRLLSKISAKSDKKLVLITNNKSLIALTAAAKIPHAKTLQSKPEMAEIAALEVDEGEDLIDGSNLPVGELAKTAENKDESLEKDIDSLDVDKDEPEYVPPKADKTAAKSKNKVKVPNFPKFRKKVFLIIGGVVLLVVFLIWAIWFAPSAKVIVTAKTEAAPVSEVINLNGSSATDLTANNVQSITKTVKKNNSVEFTATGTKTVGDKANGVMTLTNESFNEITVPAGTVFSSGQYSFTSDSDVTIPEPSGNFINGYTQGTATVNVTATEVGSAYNLSPRSYTTDASNVSAEGGQMGGGTSRKATVVTAMDVQKAKQALVDQSTDGVKQELMDQFDSGEIVISDSFKADMSDAISTPAIGEVVTGSKAKLTSPTTFSMTAISKSEMEAYLRNSIEKQISDDKTQRVYENGIKNVKLTGYQEGEDGKATVNIEATGQIGPDIDKQQIKNESKGKRYGDVQAQLEGIKGVESVDIKFPYFWVNTVPNDDKKIQVEFRISNA